MKSIDDLLSIIRDLTYEEKLRWQHGEFPNAFETDLSKYRVRVYEWTDEDDGTSGVSAQLYTGTGYGNILDSTSANEFNSKYPILHEVYVAARRSALNVSETIRGLEDVLKKLRSS